MRSAAAVARARTRPSMSLLLAVLLLLVLLLCGASEGAEAAAQTEDGAYGELQLDVDELDDEDEAGAEAGQYGDEDAEAAFHMDDFSPSHVLTFALDNYEECFFEEVSKAPMRLRGAYFVTSESDPTVSVTVSRVKAQDPGGHPAEVLFQHGGENEGTFGVVAAQPGLYRFCFRTRSGAGKQVTFALHVGVRKREHARPEHITPLEESIRECHKTLQQLVAEQNFLVTRINSHMVTQDTTEWRIGWYTCFESVFMLGVTLAQIMYVQKLINNRQWV